jgi:hypothetical protein
MPSPGATGPGAAGGAGTAGAGGADAAARGKASAAAEGGGGVGVGATVGLAGAGRLECTGSEDTVDSDPDVERLIAAGGSDAWSLTRVDAVAAIAAAAPLGVEYGLPDVADGRASVAAVEAARAEAAPVATDRGAFTGSMAGSGWVVKAPCTR